MPSIPAQRGEQPSDALSVPDIGEPTMVARALIGVVRGYRLMLSPWLGSSCRFEPTCSLYAIEALRRHGAARGGALAAWRLMRCHPLCAGGHDPVPAFPFSSSLRESIDRP